MLKSAAGQASKIYISDPLWHTVAPLRDILAGALLPHIIKLLDYTILYYIILFNRFAHSAGPGRGAAGWWAGG